MAHSKILWQDSFEMNIDIIDEQHKKLLTMINEMNQDDTIFNDDAHIAEFIGKLKDYTHYHFKTEETLMAEFQIDGYDEHVKLHQHIIHTLDQITTTFADNPAELLLQINNLLSEWFVNHILFEDKVIAQTLSEKYNNKITTRY